MEGASTATSARSRLDLKEAADADVLLRLVDDADVLVENFRPGTLERLGLGPDGCSHAINPRLVITRVTGFGQDGPVRDRPGFATIAEAMSGLAAISGEPDGQPLLPPIALTDEVTGLAAAFATMVALHSGVGQVVDVSLLESMFQLMGPLISLYRLTGEQQPRLGAGLPYTVPRGTYRCSDGKWVGLSTSSATASPARVNWRARRRGDDRFAHVRRRACANRDALEAVMSEWCARHTAGRGARRVHRGRGGDRAGDGHGRHRADPHYAARDAIVDVDGTPMQGLIAKLVGDARRAALAGPAPRRRRERNPRRGVGAADR